MMTSSATFPRLDSVPESGRDEEEGADVDTRSLKPPKRRNSLRRLRSKSLTRIRFSSSSSSSHGDVDGQGMKRPPLPASSSAPAKPAVREDGASLALREPARPTDNRQSTSSAPPEATATNTSVRPHNLSASHSPTPQPPAWPAERRYCSCYCEENVYLLAQQLDEQLRKTHDGPSSGWKWDVWVALISNENKTVLLWQQRASQSSESNYPVVWDYHVVVIVSAQRVKPADARPVTAPGDGVTENDGDGESDLKTQRRRSLFPSFKRRSTAISKRSANNVAVPMDASTTSAAWLAWVYDIDSTLCYPADNAKPPECVPFDDYIAQTFNRPAAATSEFRPIFRLARADAFFDNFASDRSHMLVDQADRGSAVGGKPAYTSPPPTWPCIVGPRAKHRGWSNNLFDSWLDMSTTAVDAGSALGAEYQFGKVYAADEFFKGEWDLPEWRRRQPQQQKQTKRRSPRHGTANGANGVGDNASGPFSQNDEPPSIQRITSWNFSSPGKSSSRRQQHSTRILDSGKPRHDGDNDGEVVVEDDPLTASKIHFNPSSPGAPPIEARKGGRVTSPLFPAYMHAVYQHRAAKKRDSYLALRDAAGRLSSGASGGGEPASASASASSQQRNRAGGA